MINVEVATSSIITCRVERELLSWLLHVRTTLLVIPTLMNK